MGERISPQPLLCVERGASILSMGKSRPDVFAYFDYREFLADYYAYGKAKFSLSYRGFARRAGVKSPSFLKFVTDGRRNLSPGTAARVAKACSCEDGAVDFFVKLVAFNQAEDAAERRGAYQDLLKFENFQRARPLEMAREAYYANWYHVAIRELVASPSFREDPKWIASVLRPRIRPSQAKKAVARLEQLGLLGRDDDGELRQIDEVVISGSGTGSIHMTAFHRGMMERASASIDCMEKHERDVSAVTLCVNAEGLLRLREQVRLIRREIVLDKTLTEGSPVQVVQLNFQLFPLTDVVTD